MYVLLEDLCRSGVGPVTAGVLVYMQRGDGRVTELCGSPTRNHDE